MKVWTKVELSDSIDHYISGLDYDYKIGIDVLAWEFYDEECDIDHENWKKYNENWDDVAEVTGIIRGNKIDIWVEYKTAEIEAAKTNFMIQKAIKEGIELVTKELDHMKW